MGNSGHWVELARKGGILKGMCGKWACLQCVNTILYVIKLKYTVLLIINMLQSTLLFST